MYAPSLTSVVLDYPGAMSIPMNLAEAEGFYKHGPPGRGRRGAQRGSINMATWRWAKRRAEVFYKHGPLGGGRRGAQRGSINMAHLAVGKDGGKVYKHGPPGGGRTGAQRVL